MKCGLCGEEKGVAFLGKFTWTLVALCSTQTVELNYLCENCRMYFMRLLRELLDGNKPEVQP